MRQGLKTPGGLVGKRNCGLFQKMQKIGQNQIKLLPDRFLNPLIK